MPSMASVSIRDLRNHGGDVVDRAMRGEHITITRSGKAVAELLPTPKPALSSEALVSHRRQLPALDPRALRNDLDRLLDADI